MSSFYESAPNPQFVRQNWIDLTGTWRFRYDDDDTGLEHGWWKSEFDADSLEIEVPYPPESEMSGIGDTSFHPVVWYQRTLPEIPADAESRTILRFGAVDFEATVWIDDTYIGSHRGGSSPFTFDVSTHWLRSLLRPRLTVRAFDDPLSTEQPRGKQAWTLEPDRIWYHRTTGIWQPVWLEFTPETYIEYMRWEYDPQAKVLQVDVELNRAPGAQIDIELTVTSPDGGDAAVTIPADKRLASGTIDLRGIGELETLLWSPQSPTVLSTRAETSTGDAVDGYIGLRSVSLDERGFAINDQPVWLRFVLSQGYFPQSHYAAPSPEAIRREVELTLALGFNGARTHQKAEDPRYLYWADRLGLLIWGEVGAAYTWSDQAVADLGNEWRELVRQDINHPSVIAWVPFNESWGIDDVSNDSRQQNAVRTMYSLTNAIDGSRPVIGNDGWEHVSTDILSLHDYNWDGSELRARYSSGKNNEQIAESYSVAGRKAVAAVDKDLNQLPLMITEYGGVSYAPSDDESWYGYGKVTTEQQFVDKYRELTSALHASEEIVGICYTQLTDTVQETNGLLTENREPKIDIETIRRITQGEKQ